MSIGLYGDGLGTRRKVFVSYHHGGDQRYYDDFSELFHDKYEIIRDNSLERKVDSDNVDYVMRVIRERYLTGSSCTLVLCGRETPQRKYVDWEILASLNQKMGLVAVLLPSILRGQNGGTYKPLRLQDNIDSRYASWVPWQDLMVNPHRIGSIIEAANSRPKNLIANNRERKIRNG